MRGWDDLVRAYFLLMPRHVDMLTCLCSVMNFVGYQYQKERTTPLVSMQFSPPVQEEDEDSSD